MADKSHKQRVEQLVFAAHYAHSKSKADNQLKDPLKKSR